VFHPTSAGSFSSHYTSTPSVLTALIISGPDNRFSRICPGEKPVQTEEGNESENENTPDNFIGSVYSSTDLSISLFVRGVFYCFHDMCMILPVQLTISIYE
jgi:hypothetical protein